MSTRQMEITHAQLSEASFKYCDAVAKLPPDLQKQCPTFEKFLSPANYTSFNSDPIGLSITGTVRYKMLWSPHATTLLAMYAAQRFDKNEAEGYEM